MESIEYNRKITFKSLIKKIQPARLKSFLWHWLKYIEESIYVQCLVNIYYAQGKFGNSSLNSQINTVDYKNSTVDFVNSTVDYKNDSVDLRIWRIVFCSPVW